MKDLRGDKTTTSCFNPNDSNKINFVNMKKNFHVNYLIKFSHSKKKSIFLIGHD